MQIDTTHQITRAANHAIFVVVPRFNVTTLITMIETMRIANYLASEPIFSWDIISFDNETIIASNGMKTIVRTDLENLPSADFIFVLGSWGTEHYDNRSLTAWLRKRARAGESICGVELGCYIIARAGLLDRKPATTHWSWLSGFRESFDRVDVQESLFTIKGKIITCSGGLAGVDLMLRLIEKTHGSSFSGEIADQMLHHPIRNANSPQRSTMGRSTKTMLPLVREAMTMIEENIEEPLSVPELAKTLEVSQRQLERQFKKHVGCTVVQFGLLRRLQNARLLLISTSLTVREIATASGFNTLSHFAFSFGKFFGRRPSEYREAWPVNETAPSWPGSLSDFLSTLKKNSKHVQPSRD
ncbi:MAG TPA: AraC family transcriptional regulator [Rhodobacteraceae bacterium]|nr:GlxA family transcriptional regulator [Alphaproteobacteria bacterium]HAB37861.1 AraC family transcriptional regulator [Paracoccaceae bacterium]